MPFSGSRWPGWLFVALAAALTGVAAVLGPLWLPGALASGAGAVAAVVAGVWVARGTSALQASDDYRRARSGAVWHEHASRLPLVRDLEDPVTLGVHPAASWGVSRPDRCPAFVARDADSLLKQALRRDRFLLLVGESTAGKSRAAYELVRAELPGHRLVQPSGRASVQAAAELAADTPQSVLWLDDLERFLGYGGLAGAAVRRVLEAAGDARYIVATMRSEEHAKFSGRLTAGLDGIGREALRQGWDVLRLAARVDLPRMWSPQEIARARRNVVDVRLVEAVGHAREYGVAEYLAAAPQLLAEWRDAWAPATHPRAAAMVLAAVDARRAGIHRPLTMSVLRQVHKPYLRRRGGARLRPEAVEDALAWATTPLCATSSLLIPADGGFLAFDYLIDAVVKDRVPAEAIDALIEFATPEEALDLGEIAWRWSLTGQAELAFRRAENGGLFRATERHCHLIREDRDGCAAALRFAQDAAEWCTAAFGPDHPQTLKARELVGWETGIGGDAGVARRLLETLAIDSERVLGADHKQTLGVRFGIAEMMGLAGDEVAAARQYEALVSDYYRLFDEDDEMTLRCRGQVAFWTGRAGDTAQAVHLFRVLLEDMDERSPGEEALATRYRLAMCLVQAGRYEAALNEWDQLIEQETANQGRLWASVLDARERHAWCVGEAGDPERAVHLLEALCADADELREPGSITMLGIRRSLAWWIGEAGNAAEAAQRFRALLQETIRQRGHDDIRVTDLQLRLTYWTANDRPFEEVIDRLEWTVAQMKQKLGATHEVTRACRRELARRLQQRLP